MGLRQRTEGDDLTVGAVEAVECSHKELRMTQASNRSSGYHGAGAQCSADNDWKEARYPSKKVRCVARRLNRWGCTAPLRLIFSSRGFEYPFLENNLAKSSFVQVVLKRSGAIRLQSCERGSAELGSDLALAQRPHRRKSLQLRWPRPLATFPVVDGLRGHTDQLSVLRRR